MSVQRCWDCGHANIEGMATKKGTPRKDAEFRCVAPVPASLICRDKVMVEPDDGQSCKCFTPRKEQP
jgi:hypothetical protein